MSGMGTPAFTFHNALTKWEAGPFPLAVLAVLLAIAVWYLRADWKLAVRARRWPWYRTASFMVGLAAVDMAIQSPVATFTGRYFPAHVIQHLLLMVVAPLFGALGAPSTLLLQTSSRRMKTRWLAVLRSGPFAALSFPVTVWFLYFGVMFVFFLTSLINTAMEHMWLMDIFNLGFLFGGTLYWWPLVAVDPIIHWRMDYGMRMLNALLGAPFEAFLGIAIMSDGAPIASMYSLSSTHAGGGLLWASTEMSSIGAFLPIFIQWMHSEARVAVRADRRAARSAAIARVGSDTPDAGDEPVTGGANMANTANAASSAWEEAWMARRGGVPQTASPSPATAYPPGNPDGGPRDSDRLTGT